MDDLDGRRWSSMMKMMVADGRDTVFCRESCTFIRGSSGLSWDAVHVGGPYSCGTGAFFPVMGCRYLAERMDVKARRRTADACIIFKMPIAH